MSGHHLQRVGTSSPGQPAGSMRRRMTGAPRGATPANRPAGGYAPPSENNAPRFELSHSREIALAHLGEHVLYNHEMGLPTGSLTLDMYWSGPEEIEEAQPPQRGRQQWSPAPSAESPMRNHRRERSESLSGRPCADSRLRSAAHAPGQFGEPPPNGGPPPQNGARLLQNGGPQQQPGAAPQQNGGIPLQNLPGNYLLQPHPPAGRPPGQGPPPAHPIILAAGYRPPLERYTLFVDRERQAWRVSSDNAYLIPTPSTSEFHHWDANLLARMCRTAWDEYRTAINRILYPLDTEWNAVLRKRQSAEHSSNTSRGTTDSTATCNK